MLFFFPFLCSKTNCFYGGSLLFISLDITVLFIYNIMNLYFWEVLASFLVRKYFPLNSGILPLKNFTAMRYFKF